MIPLIDDSILNPANSNQIRGIVGFLSEEEPKMTYQNDNAEPEKVGLSILNDAVSMVGGMDLEDAMDTIKKIRLHDEDADVSTVTGSLQEARRHLPKGVVNTNARDFYTFMEPLQGTLRHYINGLVKAMPNGNEFVCDGLFCKWGYIINLDNKTLDVLRGDQEDSKEPLYGIFTQNPNYGYGKHAAHPCQIVKSYQLENLPDKDIFLKDLAHFKLS